MSTPTRALALRIIELACRAPSVHNSQPWRWHVADRATIELHADRHRQLPLSDPSGRNLALSCGAALHHAFVAAESLGLAADIELMPVRDEEDLLARISLSPGTPTDSALESIQALEERRTDRRRFTSWPIPDSRLAHLAEAASAWGAHAIPITDATARSRTEELVRRAAAIQATDPRLAEEQRQWIAHSRVDGMPAENASPPAHGRPPTRPNRFATAIETPPDDDPAGESSDGLVAICTAADDQRSWLAAGESLSALWLQATHDGLSAVPLSQIIEVDETREALHKNVFESMARPQILVRIGWSETTRTRLDATPRRVVGEVMER